VNRGLAGRIAHAFIDSRLTPLVMIGSLLLGLFSILETPREEEPQIVVPMLDVFVGMPGASAKEVEQRVTIPMEQLLRDVPGVEYLYSTSQPGGALVIVRFYVGTKEEDAIIRTYNKLYSNFDRIPQGVSQPLIKARSIDDVPVLAVTLWGKNYDGYALRRIAAEVQQNVKQVENVSETTLLGGQRRQVRVTLNPQRLAAYHVSPLALAGALQSSNQRSNSGSFAQGNQEIAVESGAFLQSADDLRKIVVTVQRGRPVYLSAVAEIADGPEEPGNYVYYGAGAASADAATHPAVTLAVAKRKGTNATNVSHDVLARLDSLRGYVIPSDVQLSVTRNYGQTAKHKSDELLKHLFLATLSVALLVALALGWRESGVVLLAIPVTLALTLFIFYAYGYTLNRVTLFALIFSIGILVDDAIVVVENIVRHFRLAENKERRSAEVAVEAVNEVGNPTILATFAVIAAILPMAFVRGLMGPYMRPIPVGASAAMLFSLIIAFVVSPWAALRLLRGHTGKQAGGETEGWSTRSYRKVMTGLVTDRKKRWMFLASVVVLFLLACSLVAFKAVRVKMLPFDNKSEFQVVVDMPEGTPLERTLALEEEIGGYLHTQSEVLNYQIYAGTSGPYNFNGLVRHYYLRRGANQGDIQVNLRQSDERKRQSHDLAKEMRGPIQDIAKRWNARVKVAEVPPGPPVVATLVAEVYGPDYQRQIEVAKQVRQIFDEMPGVVDVDWYVVADQKKLEFEVQQDKSVLRGISSTEVSQSVNMALAGAQVGLLHDAAEREDVKIHVQLSRASRSSEQSLSGLYLDAPDGAMVPLGELARVHETSIDKNVYRKNLRDVVYVIGDVAGAEESPVYAIGKLDDKIRGLKIPEGYQIEQFTAIQPPDPTKIAIKWDGEWHITYEVFRDLGLAFAAVLVLIYVLVVGWFQSFKTPLVIMAPIPLTLVGILPAHAAMGAFFTATSMIGFIAGAGIIVRNSIILVDFIKLRRSRGMSLEEAVVDAGAVRFRPMLLTAAAVVVGAGVILFDPIFQGLAISLMAGEVASTLLSRMAVPILYYMSERHRISPGSRTEGSARINL
jgi:multidrug efflux pump subunit AcrB